MNQMNIKYTENNLIIEIPIDRIIFTQENREDFPFRVTDQERMIKWLEEFLLEYNNKEDGSTAWTEFVDNAFIEAYESGETWLEGIVPSEYDEKYL